MHTIVELKKNEIACVGGGDDDTWDEFFIGVFGGIICCPCITPILGCAIGIVAVPIIVVGGGILYGISQIKKDSANKGQDES